MMTRARLLAVNHVAVELGEAEEALDFYGHIFEVELRGGRSGMAFIDAGNQFIASPRAGWNRPMSTSHRPRGERQESRPAGSLGGCRDTAG